ncbi:DNA topoisomerase IB [Kitasatospora purpeofusca]|uniref:DNA topoisomerase IB n=1 Tax=Kitasatospora purpeofusca TaxID=67352 RepID=UPI002A59ECD4|nr:DNA topoisomerase IB [Kitasatospora purpeofusca]MDY0810852.1 DNA topoisomerase IB [Kitasatospora purpeofusca]
MTVPRTARLTTSDPTRPGWTRVRHGSGFGYRDTTGTRIHDAGQLARLKALVIPPAWTDVWICPDPRGHIQALGTDAAGRRQYLYHPEFRAQQEAAKHDHVLTVARRLPELRARVASDLELRGLQHDRVAACAARLLDLGFFRIGSPAYEEANGSYGLTTLRRDQTTVHGGTLHFAYPAKSGRERDLTLTDRPAARTVRALLRRRDDSPGLWAYWAHRRWEPLTAPDLNAYLRAGLGTDVSAKDFRTWHATVLAAVGLAVSWPQAGRSAAARRRAAARVVRETAAYLGNTPTVCRASYLNPRLFELYDQGDTITAALPDLAPGRAGPDGLPGTGQVVELAVLDLLGER